MTFAKKLSWGHWRKADTLLGVMAGVIRGPSYALADNMKLTLDDGRMTKDL